jgi:hypothetical protein
MQVNKLFLLVLLIAAAIFGFTTSRSMAQTNPRYIPLGGAATGALYTPNSGVYSHVGIIAGHPTGNSLGYTMGKPRVHGALHEHPLLQQRSCDFVGDNYSRCEGGD